MIKLLTKNKLIKNNKNKFINNTKNISTTQNIVNDKTNFNLIPFTKIVYINLDDRTDRKEIFEKFYQKEIINPIRFSAKKTNIKQFKNKHPKLTLGKSLATSNNLKWVNGTLGCYDSHYTILKNHLNDNNNSFLVILEDDCTIKTEDLNKCLNLLQNNKDIDILRINCWLSIPTNPYIIETNNKHSKYFSEKDNPTKYFDGGTHCCIYHIKNIPKVIKFMENENVFQIDALLSNNLIKSVVYKIPTKIKYFSQSSIQKKCIDRDSPLFYKLMKNRKL